MSYPGDPSLASDIRQRVLDTFDETARLAQEGKREEAELGCDFMLRLDPLFTPARRLQERLASGDGPVETADLRRAHEASQPSPEVLKTVRLSPEEIEKLMAEGPSQSSEESQDPVAPAGPETVPDQAGVESVQEAESIEEAGGDEEAAEPKTFLDGARRALEAGELDTASRLLEMAGSLDPDEPELDTIRARLEAAAAETPAPLSDASEEAPEIEVDPAILGSPDSFVAEEATDEEPATPEGGDRVQELLAEGQRAFDDERYQEAIDSWSRIFLVDINHAEATRRIELARELKEEQDREVEEIFHRGTQHAEDGERDEAIRAFGRVLELRPHHLAAQEQLSLLGAEAPASQDEEPLFEEAPDAGPEVESDVPELTSAGKPTAADSSYRAVARAKRAPVSRFFVIGSAVFVLVLVGVWLLVSNWGRLFPNASEEPVETRPGQRIAELTTLWERGQTEEALAGLEAIPPESADYLRARRLLARWRAEVAEREETAEEDVVLSGEEEAVHRGLVASAREAYDGGEYLHAARLFTRASSMAPLSAAEAALYEDSKRQLEPIAQQIDLYTQRQWELVLPGLWRRLEQEPQDNDVRRLLVNSYYNLALRELRRHNASEAVDYAAEAVELDPEDEDTRRLEQFARTYTQYPRDLLYEIFVEELEFRL